ncbi:MAG: SDR family oxidoreductase [Flavobacteriaceae bacterium]|nr:SDR family oxidoreductase [Flavobacteriaceae bacterium]
MDKVFIIGANGLTGREVCKILKKSELYKPIAMIRKKEQEEYFKDIGVDCCMGDLEKDFSEALKGMSRLIFAAGSGSKTGSEKTTSVDEEGAKKAVDFAEEHQLDKYVMLSSIGTYEPEKAGELEHYIRAKKAADDYLRNSGLNYTIVQPGGLTNKEATNQIQTAERLNKYGEIPRKDVAKILVKCLDLNIARNKSFEVVSGEVTVEKALKEMSE